MALSENALTTLAVVKEDLGISGSTEDTYLERIIEIATDRIESYCNRVFFNDTAIVEYVPGYGSTFLTVARAPINSITTIHLDDSLVSDDDYSIHDEEAGTIHNPNGWVWTASKIQNITGAIIPGSEDITYKVTYNGGWFTQNQIDIAGTGARTLPYDIEQACVDLVVLTYRQKGKDQSIKGESLMSYSVSYGSASLPESVAQVLDMYKMVAIA